MIRVELMEKWLADRGKKLTSEDKQHSRVFLPYLIMDTAYQVYCKHIMTVPASFRLLQLRKALGSAFSNFSKDFFRCFTIDESCEITDEMDGFESYIGNDVVILKLALMKQCEDYPLEKQQVICSGMIVNILAQCAEVIYEDSFKRETRLGGTRRLVGERNDLIEAVARATMRFLKEYNKNGRDIDFNSSKDIDDCVNIICKRIVQFISKKIDN